MLWGKVQLTGEHVDDVGGLQRFILKYCIHREGKIRTLRPAHGMSALPSVSNSAQLYLSLISGGDGWR